MTFKQIMEKIREFSEEDIIEAAYQCFVYNLKNGYAVLDLEDMSLTGVSLNDNEEIPFPHITLFKITQADWVMGLKDEDLFTEKELEKYENAIKNNEIDEYTPVEDFLNLTKEEMDERYKQAFMAYFDWNRMEQNVINQYRKWHDYTNKVTHILSYIIYNIYIHNID